MLFNYPEFGGHLIIGKFCAIASGVRFIMGPANHRISSVTTYPFHVFGGAWAERTPPHMDQLPRKGDTVIGNDGRCGSGFPEPARADPGVPHGRERTRNSPAANA